MTEFIDDKAAADIKTEAVKDYNLEPCSSCLTRLGAMSLLRDRKHRKRHEIQKDVTIALLREALNDAREGFALMAEGEGPDSQDYRDISMSRMKDCDKALTATEKQSIAYIKAGVWNKVLELAGDWIDSGRPVRDLLSEIRLAAEDYV